MKDNVSSAPFVPTEIWNSSFIRIMIVSTMLFTLNQISIVAFPLFLTELQASPAVIGASTSLLTLVAMGSRPLVGSMTDRRGRKFVMVIGLAVLAASALGYAFVPIVAIAMVFRAFNGYGIAATSTANMTIAADVLPPTKIQNGLAYFGLCETVASAIGPTLAFALIIGANFVPVWVTAAGIGVVAIIITMTFTYEKRVPKKVQQKPQDNTRFLWRFLEKSAFAPSLIQIITVFTASGVMAFLAPHAVEANIENISVFYAVQAFSMCIIRVILGKLLPMIRTPFVVLVPAAVCHIASFILISMMTDLTLMIPAAILYGLGVGTFIATVSVHVMSNAAPARRGAASSTFYLMCDIGACIGGIVSGQIANALGYTEMFRVYAVLPALALTLSFFVLRPRKGKIYN